MRFELTGRLIFEAADTEDAFRLLASHFKALAEGRESDLPLIGTDVKIKAVGLETPVPPESATKTTYRGPRKP